MKQSAAAQTVILFQGIEKSVRQTWYKGNKKCPSNRKGI